MSACKNMWVAMDIWMWVLIESVIILGFWQGYVHRSRCSLYGTERQRVTVALSDRRAQPLKVPCSHASAFCSEPFSCRILPLPRIPCTINMSDQPTIPTFKLVLGKSHFALVDETIVFWRAFASYLANLSLICLLLHLVNINRHFRLSNNNLKLAMEELERRLSWR